MKERPILYSAPMVREVLEDRKTQTRRVVKSFKHLVPALGEERDCIKDVDGLPSRLDIAPRNWDCCPYGVPGDRLWVREAVWLPPPVTQHDLREGADTWPKCVYSADTDDTEIAWMRDMRWKQRPSIHMPRWASRILLEVTDVRVQRVQEINEADAVAEGVEEGCVNYQPDYDAVCDRMNALPACGAVARYSLLWDSINAKRGYGWEANPWVWAITFRRIEDNAQ